MVGCAVFIMKTTLLRRVITSATICGVLLSFSAVEAALPPIQPAQRVAQSDIVAQARVVAIIHRVVKNNPGLNDDYLAKVVVEKATKGKVRRGQTLTVHYWRLKERSGGWAGPVGQNTLPQSGQRGTLFLKRGASTRAPYELLQPNGWEMSK